MLQSVSPLDALDRLDALLEASLLQRFDDAEGGSRYQMLETIREFALERLAAAGEVDAIRDRHATAFLSFAEEGEIALVAGLTRPGGHACSRPSREPAGGHGRVVRQGRRRAVASYGERLLAIAGRPAAGYAMAKCGSIELWRSDPTT